MIRSLTRRAACLTWMAMLMVGGTAIGEVPSSECGLINIETRTFGGSQLWTDERIHHGWRIQRHALTGHYRLLDAQNVRKAFGSYEHCLEAFDRQRRELSIPDVEGRVVIALHGIGRTRQSMQGVCDYLAEQGGYQTLNMTYASTRHELGKHAKALAKVVEGLGPEVTEINFVTHSMGGLVVRHYLGDMMDPSLSPEPDDRVHRLVMIGPPNQCPNMAKQANRLQAFKLIWGPSGQQMANWDSIASRLAVPTCEFGIIAGGNEQETGHNPLLQGNDDLVVSVEETRLLGAHDFIVLPFIHSFFHKPEVYDKLHCFLENGYFVSEETRQPLLR